MRHPVVEAVITVQTYLMQSQRVAVSWRDGARGVQGQPAFGAEVKPRGETREGDEWAQQIRPHRPAGPLPPNKQVTFGKSPDGRLNFNSFMGTDVSEHIDRATPKSKF